MPPPGMRPGDWWHELIPGGCSLHWFTSTTGPGSPVMLYDYDKWDPECGNGHQPERCVLWVVESLREWLWTWAEGDRVHGLVPLTAMLIDE